MPKHGPHRDPEAQQRILDATRELICERGPNQVSINEIASAANVGKQTIYRWWPSKAAVVVDALEQMIKAANPPPTTGSAYGDIQTQMRRVAQSLASPTGAIIRELVAESQGDPDVAEMFRAGFFTERRSRAAAVIQAGIDSGELSSAIDVETSVDILYAPMWLRLLIGHQPLSVAAADQILDHVWPALAAPDSSGHMGAEPRRA